MKKKNRSVAMLFLFLAGVSARLLPELLLTILFCLKGSSLPEYQLILCRGIGILGGIPCLMAALYRLYYMPGEKNPGYLKRALPGMLPVIFFYLSYEFGMERIYSVLIRTMPQSYTLIAIVTGFCSILWIVLQGLGIYSWIILAAPVRPERPIRLLLRHPLMLAGVILLPACAVSFPDLIAWGLSYLPETFRMTFSAGCLIKLLIAAGQALLFLIPAEISASAAVSAGKTKEGKAQEERPAGRLPALLCLAGGIVILVVEGISYYRKSPVDLICSSLEEAMTSGGYKIIQGDIEGGLSDLESAKRTFDLWAAVIEMDGAVSLNTLLNENPSDTAICYLWCARNGQTERAEEFLRVHELDPEFGLLLLDLYADRTELTQREQIYYQEIVYACASAGVFAPTYLRPSDLEGYEERLESRLRGYEELTEWVSLVRVASDILRNGGQADRDLVLAGLDLAEEYPDNLYIQYLAASCGSSLSYDGANHYDRTIQAAGRYEQLYREEMNPSDEELCNLKLNTAQMMINCYGYEQALSLIEEAVALGGIEQAYSMAAQCYEALERYEDCYELSMALLETDPSNLSALYYSAVSALKSGYTQEALVQTSLLASRAMEDVTPADYSADIALYAMLQFLTLQDSSSWTQYRYAVYDNLTQEQQEIIAENPFFSDYIDAVYLNLESTASGHYEQALDAVGRVLEKNDSLPQAWYLKGAILYGMERFEEAAEAYQRSLAIEEESATVWYALANAYDGMEEYELAYEACERTMALVPLQDHGSDWYGVSVHCQSLMNALAGRLEGGN